ARGRGPPPRRRARRSLHGRPRARDADPVRALVRPPRRREGPRRPRVPPARAAVSAALSIVTWNVHHCRGLDGRVVPERIARTIEALGPDLVALQELDVGRARTHRVDQPAWLA